MYFPFQQYFSHMKTNGRMNRKGSVQLNGEKNLKGGIRTQEPVTRSRDHASIFHRDIVLAPFVNVPCVISP